MLVDNDARDIVEAYITDQEFVLVSDVYVPTLNDAQQAAIEAAIERGEDFVDV